MPRYGLYAQISGVSVRVGMIIRLRARKEESGLKRKKNSVLVAYNCIGIDRVLYTTLIHARGLVPDTFR